MAQGTDPYLQKSIDGHRRPIEAVTFAGSSKSLVSGSSEGTVLVSSTASEQTRPIRFEAHKEGVYSLAYDPEQKLIASASRDKTIRLWHPTVLGTSTGRATVIRGHLGPVRSAVFSQDSKHLLSTSDDKLAKVWSLPRAQCVATLAGHSNWVRSGRLTSDCRLAATVSDDRSLRLWDIQTRQCLRKVETRTAGLRALELFLGGSNAVVGAADGSLLVMDFRAAARPHVLGRHMDAITALSMHPGRDCLLSASKDGSLSLWDMRRLRPMFTLRAHTGAVMTAAFSPDGTSLASGGADARLLLWGTNDGTWLSENQHKRSAVAGASNGAQIERNHDSCELHIRGQKAMAAEPALAVTNGPSQHSSLPTDAWQGWPAVDPVKEMHERGNVSLEPLEVTSGSPRVCSQQGIGQWIGHASPQSQDYGGRVITARELQLHASEPSSNNEGQEEAAQKLENLCMRVESMQGTVAALQKELHACVEAMRQGYGAGATDVDVERSTA